MLTDRSLPQQWPQLVASRLALSDERLHRLIRQDDKLREICMDYAECALAVKNASSRSPANLKRIQEYRELECEIAAELRHQLQRYE